MATPVWVRGCEGHVEIVDAAAGLVRCVPARKKVAIVGFASSSRDFAPWTDDTYELWGINQAYEHFQRQPDRWFEIHTEAERQEPAVPTYEEDLRALGCPLYMIRVEPRFPNSVAYPLDAIRARVPQHLRRFFTSTGAYMVALALHEGFEAIALYGIDATIGTEYEQQKGCLEAWLSYAAGRGVDVIIPKTSALFKVPFMYGYEPARAWPMVFKASKAFIDARINEHKRVSNELLTEMHKIEGAIQELQYIVSFAESRGRGAQFPTVEGTPPPTLVSNE